MGRCHVHKLMVNARDDLARWINGGVVGAWSYGHKGGVDAIDGENNVQMR